MGNKHAFTLLALVLVTCFVGDVRCGIIGEQGKSLTLNPQTRGELKEVTWTHNGNKVVEYDQQQILIFDPFKKRVVLDLYTGALTIKKLNAGDDGVYESAVVAVDGKTQYSKHDLQVIDTVPEPKVTCKEADPESEETTLLCGVDSDTPVGYRWRGPTVYDHPGSELKLGKQEDLDSVFTCFVKNEISEKYATFTLRDCQKDGIPPGIIVVIILSVIGALCLLFLIPLILVCRRKLKKSPQTNQSCKQEDVENGENKNLLSPMESTYNGTDEEAKKRKPKGLFRAVHHKKCSGLEDTDNEGRASFSLRATLPSHAKLQPPRVRHEQANGTCEEVRHEQANGVCEAKDVNGPDKSSASGLQQVDEGAEKCTPVSAEVTILDQRAVVVPLSSHGTRLVPAVINNISDSKEHLDTQMAVKQDGDQSINEDEELPNGSPEGVLEKVIPYHSHNITVTIEGRDKRESHEEEENLNDTDRGTDAMSESRVEEEKDGNRPWTDIENSQEEVDREPEKSEEDAGLHVQENHEMLVEESSVDKERNGEEIHSDQTEEEEADISELKEEPPETEQVLKEHLKEDAPKDEKENEHDGQDEVEMDSETESLGKEEDTGPAQEKEKIFVEEEEGIITQEQPLRESDKGNNTPEAQVKTELEVRQIEIGDGKEQAPHGNESLDEERTRDREDGELDPKKKNHDRREGEMESAVEQGDDGDINTNQKEEENEFRHDPDENTVSGSSEQEDQLAQQAPDAKVEAHQIDSQDDSVADETNGYESVIRSVSEGTETYTPVEDKKQEEQNRLKEGEQQSTPKEETDVTEDQDSSLPKDQDIQDVSVTVETIDEESKIKSEHITAESNPQLEEKSEEGKDPVRQEDPFVSGEQDCLSEDHRINKVISDDDETHDDQDRKTDIMNNYDPAKDLDLEKEFKQDQAEQDQQQTDTNSPVEIENESNTPETKNEGKTEHESSFHLEEKTQEKQNPTRQGDDHNIPQEEPIVPGDQSTDKVISDDETLDDQDQDRKTGIMNNHDQAEDLLQEPEFKQEQPETDEQQNDRESPAEQVGTPDTKDEEKTESEQENQHCQEEGREESKLPQTEYRENAMDPLGELQNKNHLEEGVEEEERGQVDYTHPQDQQLKEEQLTVIHLEERQNDKHITDSGGEEENESHAQTDTDVPLAKEKSEGEAQIEGESELKKEEVSEAAADKVQEDPAVGNEMVIAVDEKEHNGTKDPVTENVGDLYETEKPPPTEEKDVDQRPDGTQKDGQHDLNNSTQQK